MEAESRVYVSFLGQIARYLGATEPALRLLLSILAGYPLALFHRRYLYGKKNALQHLFFIVTGLILGYFNYGADILHSTTSVIVTYVILVLTGGTAVSVFLVFVFSMSYLLMGYYMTGTETYDIKWTMPQCVLTLRLIGLAFDVYDGKKPPDQLSADQKKTALNRIPNLLEIAGHIYFPSSFFVGPQFPMKRYLNFVSGLYADSEDKSALPSCMYAALRRGGLGFVYLGLYQLGTALVPDNFLLSEAYGNLPFWKKCLYMGLWGKVTLYKYISCWLISEGVCISFGLTHNGKSKDGETLWDGCANVKLRVFEGASKFGHYIMSFNTNTNHWVAQYIYKRLKFMGNRFISQGLALLFLAIWHGLHSGYYMCFFMEFIVVYLEKDVEVLLAKHEQLKLFFEQQWVQPILWVILKLYTFVFMGYCLVPFALLSFSRWWHVYKSVYFIGHIVFGLWPLYYPGLKILLSKLLPPKNERRKE